MTRERLYAIKSSIRLPILTRTLTRYHKCKLFEISTVDFQTLQATMLRVFENDLKTYSTLRQRKVALKCVLCYVLNGPF